MSKVHVFVSYSHADARWFDEDRLMPRLIKSLELAGVEVWYDRGRLGGGDPWKQEIVDNIKKAHIALLLVSRNFLNSDFIREVELPRIEKRAESGELVVIPILIGHCDWQNLRILSKPQMVPGKPTPLIRYLDSPAEWDQVQEEIFASILRQIERIRNRLNIPAPSMPAGDADMANTLTRISGFERYVPRTQPVEARPPADRAAARPGAPVQAGSSNRWLLWTVPAVSLTAAALVIAFAIRPSGGGVGPSPMQPGETERTPESAQTGVPPQTPQPMPGMSTPAISPAPVQQAQQTPTQLLGGYPAGAIPQPVAEAPVRVSAPPPPLTQQTITAPAQTRTAGTTTTQATAPRSSAQPVNMNPAPTQSPPAANAEPAPADPRQLTVDALKSVLTPSNESTPTNQPQRAPAPTSPPAQRTEEKAAEAVIDILTGALQQREN